MRRMRRSFAIPGAGIASATAPIKIQFTGQPGTAIAYAVSVVDSAGLESARKHESVKTP